MGIAETFQILSYAKSDQVLPALLEGLKQSDIRIVDASVEALMQQRSESGFLALIDHYQGLSPSSQEKISRSIYRMQSTLENIIRFNKKSPRQKVALEILRKNTSVDSLPLLTLLLEDEDETIRNEVSNSIQLILRRFIEEKNAAERQAHASEEESRRGSTRKVTKKVTKKVTGSIRSTERIKEDMRLVLQALEKGLESLSFHRSPIIVRSACQLGPEGHELLYQALKHEERINSTKDAIIDQLIQDNSTITWEFLFTLLGHTLGYFRTIAIKVIQSKPKNSGLEGLIYTLERLPLDQQRRIIRISSAIPWLPLLERDLDRLEPEYADFLFREVNRLEISSSEKLPYWAALLSSYVSDIVQPAIEHLTRSRDKHAEEILARLLTFSKERTQLLLIEQLVKNQHPALYKLLAPLVTSDNEKIRQLAGKLVARESFEKYLDAFDRLDDKTREIAGKAALELDERVIDRLTLELKAVDPAKRVKALQIISATGTSTALQNHVLELVKDPDKKVRATIIQLLAAMKHTDAIKALINLLSDNDPRVQANAVEALEALNQPEFMQLLVPFLRSSHNRLRGNACKALWTLGIKDVSSLMFAMLQEKSNLMRMTAAWVIGETRPDGGLEAIQKALLKEKSQDVRNRLLKSEQILLEKKTD